MGIVISVSENPDRSLRYAGWVVRQLFADVLRNEPSDDEMRAAFEMAEVIGGLAIERLEPALAERVSQRIGQSITEILSGRVESGIVNRPFGNADTLYAYRQALTEISHLISGELVTASSVHE